MVGASDLKVYHSLGEAGGASRCGGPITASQATNASPNNLFFNVTRAEQVAGVDEFKCAFFKNTHATESMDNFKFWLTSKKPPNDTSIEWSFDPIHGDTVGFDGVDDYINCGTQTDLWNQSHTKFTFSFWVWATAGWDGNLREVVALNPSAAYGFRCNIDDNESNLISFRIRNSANTEFRSDNYNFQLERYNSVVCVYDSTLASANLKIYVNKNLSSINPTLTQTIIPSASFALWLGGQGATDFKGYMKDFKWYNNLAANQAQVDAIFDGASNMPNPSYYLDFKQGSGNPEDQKSAKEATLVGAYWNFDAITIPSTDTWPNGMVWNGVGAEPSTINVGKVGAGTSFPIWVHFNVEAGAEARLDDSELFAFKFNIPQGGTGSSGGGGDDGGSGTGGNPPPTTSNYKIAYAADWGCENETDDVIDLVKNGGYNILVGGGDNAYASPDCWINRFNGIKSKFTISAYGNHEYSESGGIGPYKTFFGDNKTYYTWKYQNILFLVFDDNSFEDSDAPDFDVGSTQYNEMKAKLLDSLDDNTITWRIAVFHHPWFGASSDHPYNEGDQVQAYHELFQNNKVHMVWAAHNHNWQRTHQVTYNSGDPKSPNVVDSASPYVATKKGIVHVVSGGGGHDSGSSLYPLGSQPSFQAYQNRSYNGIFEVVASNNGQTLTCSFVNTDGTKFGTFTYSAT